jgi:hypothetical protein
MAIFLILNGVGVAFLLFVLVNFWKDGHRPRRDDREYAAEFKGRDWPDVLVVTHPISNSAQGGLSVISFPAPDRHVVAQADDRAQAQQKSVPSLRRISTR